jgi:hypothetical protein
MPDAQDLQGKRPETSRSPEEEREDRLDEELEETFPASDPTSPGSVLPGDSQSRD